jgi:hypothetical protein
MKTKETSTREQALAWWGNLPTSEKSIIGASTASLRNFDGRAWQNFTGREIEEIWRKETQAAYCEKPTCNNPECKTGCKELKFKERTNQKQFKQFDESLFKAYIDKFSDEDKNKAFQLIFDSIKDNNKSAFIEESEIIDWYKRNCY